MKYFFQCLTQIHDYFNIPSNLLSLSFSFCCMFVWNKKRDGKEEEPVNLPPSSIGSSAKLVSTKYVFDSRRSLIFFFFFNLLFYNCLNCKSPARIMTFFDKFIWSIHLKNRSLLNYYRKNIDVHITHNITVYLFVLIKAADRPLINTNQFQDKWKLWTRLPNKEYLTSIWKRIENLAAASKFNDQFCEFSLWLTKPCVNYSKLSAKCMK